VLSLNSTQGAIRVLPDRWNPSGNHESVDIHRLYESPNQHDQVGWASSEAEVCATIHLRDLLCPNAHQPLLLARDVDILDHLGECILG
jgi:hypothetical protein